MGRRWRFEMMRQSSALDKKGVVGKEINFAKNPKIVPFSGVQSAFGIDVLVACRHAHNSLPSPAFVKLQLLQLVFFVLPRARSVYSFHAEEESTYIRLTADREEEEEEEESDERLHVSRDM